MAGIRILTDPVLRHRIGLLRHRERAIPPANYADIDAVLISHIHLDHLDIPSLRLIDRDTLLIVPNGTRKLLLKKGFHNIKEMYIGDSINVGRVSVKSTYADHGAKRYPFGKRAESMGFMIGGDYNIYFAGDTEIFPEMADISDDLELALLPIWGWGPTLSKGHMNPYTAAKALTLLSPRFAIPIHWGTLHPLGMGWMKPRFLFDPPKDFVRHAAAIAPEVKVHVVKPGSIVDISGDSRVDAPASEHI